MSNHNIRNIYNNLKGASASASRNFAILKLYVDNNDDLCNEYTNRINEHNSGFVNKTFADSGFDVLVPQHTIFTTDIDSKFIDMQVKCEMVYCEVDNDRLTTCAFTTHPRSSISKTPLMLANHTGIIDSGYRGSLIGAFRWLRSSNYVLSQYIVDKHTRLLQICHPTLCPIYVTLVDINDLSTSERGANGFGSTGL